MVEQSERFASPDEQVAFFKKAVKHGDYLLDLTEEEAIGIIEQEGGYPEPPYNLPENASTQAKHAADALRLVNTIRSALDVGDSTFAVRQSLILGSVWERLRLTPMEELAKIGATVRKSLSKGSLAPYGGSLEKYEEVQSDFVETYRKTKREFPEMSESQIYQTVINRTDFTNERTEKPFDKKTVERAVKNANRKKTP